MDNQKDNKLAYISAKTDKLASAVYLVSSQLPDQEPIKWRLRQLALETLDFKVGSLIKPEFLECLNRLSSCLTLTMSANSVSIMNFGLLKSEYSALKEMVTKIVSTSLNQAVFVPELAEPMVSLPTQITQTKVKAEVKESNRDNHPNSEDKELRQGSILKYVKGQEWAAIKDIAKVVPDCSVKTVQRELAELVDRGVLKKKGDRRWSRYMLAS